LGSQVESVFFLFLFPQYSKSTTTLGVTIRKKNMARFFFSLSAIAVLSRSAKSGSGEGIDQRGGEKVVHIDGGVEVSAESSEKMRSWICK